MSELYSSFKKAQYAKSIAFVGFFLGFFFLSLKSIGKITPVLIVFQMFADWINYHNTTKVIFFM